MLFRERLSSSPETNSTCMRVVEDRPGSMAQDEKVEVIDFNHTVVKYKEMQMTDTVYKNQVNFKEFYAFQPSI